ncbi:hypothetical protein PG990_001635 [Apiospora arundinis]
MDSTPVHTRTWQRFRQNALYVPANPEFKLQQAIPGTLWDRADSVFLKPEQYSWVKREPPDFKIFAWDEYPREAALIFQEKYREDTMSWEDLGIIAPAVLATGNSLGIQTQSGLQHVSVSYARKFVWSEEAPVLPFPLLTRSIKTSPILALQEWKDKAFTQYTLAPH